MKRTTVSLIVASAFALPTIASAATGELALTISFAGAPPTCTSTPDAIVVAIQSANLTGFLPATGWPSQVSAEEKLTMLKIALPTGKMALCVPTANGGGLEIRVTELPKDATASAGTVDAKAAVEKNAYKPANEWSVPASPAFDIIGATPNIASLPRTPRDVAMHLVGGRAADGTIQKGLAIDVSISQLLKALPLIPATFVESASAPKAKPTPNIIESMLETFFSGKFKAENRAVENRFVDRLKFSLATTQEENNTSAPINLGIGLQYVLWDYSDQKTSCKAVGAIKDEGKDEAAAKGKEVATKICAVAPDATKDDLFASTSSAIGIANAYALKDGKWGNREIGTKGRWITIASGGLPVSPTSDKGAPRLQFIGHYRRFDNQPIPVDKTAAAQTSTTTATTVKKQDTATTALRLKVGQPSGAASLEFARTTKHPFGGASERTSRRAYGVEWKVGKDIWLVASAGREWNKTGVLKDQPLSFVLTSLRFGDKAFQSEDAAGKPK